MLMLYYKYLSVCTGYLEFSVFYNNLQDDLCLNLQYTRLKDLRIQCFRVGDVPLVQLLQSRKGFRVVENLDIIHSRVTNSFSITGALEDVETRAERVRDNIRQLNFLQ